MVSDAVQKARLAFYDRLGTSRVGAISGYDRESPPTTANGLVRAKAEMCELLLIRRDLLRSMPTFLLDPTASREVWNEEGLLRGRSTKEVQAEIESLTVEIEGYLASLGGDTDSAGGINVSVIGECPAPEPGLHSFGRHWR